VRAWVRAQPFYEMGETLAPDPGAAQSAPAPGSMPRSLAALISALVEALRLGTIPVGRAGPQLD